MKQGLSIAGLVAVLMLGAAPITLAQTAPPAAPPAATPAPAQPDMPPAAPSQTPAPPAAPSRPSVTPAPSEGDAVEARTCRTFHQPGERCSCRSAPTDFGTAEAPADGGARNLCVVPGA